MSVPARIAPEALEVELGTVGALLDQRRGGGETEQGIIARAGPHRFLGQREGMPLTAVEGVLDLIGPGIGIRRLVWLSHGLQTGHYDLAAGPVGQRDPALSNFSARFSRSCSSPS